MKVGIICTGKDQVKLKTLIQAIDPSIEIQLWPDIYNPLEIESLILWKQPSNTLTKFKNLKFISSFGAGVEHILMDPGYNHQVPVSKIIDPELNEGLFKYCLHALTYFENRIHEVIENNKTVKWDPDLGIKIETNIGILGMGEIGSYISKRLIDLNFKVIGLSNSRKNIAGVKSYTSMELDQFLKNINVLICTLPLTSKTENYLDQDIFRQLKPGSLLINIGRGKQLVEEDLLKALDENHISLAFLDVFREEPVPETHPFWKHPNIIITPHIASLTRYEVVAERYINNLRRLENGEPLSGIVNVEAGY